MIHGNPQALTLVLIFISSSSPIRSCCLSYDGDRRLLGFEDGAHRLSLGKAGLGDRIHHRREDFSFSTATGRDRGSLKLSIMGSPLPTGRGTDPLLSLPRPIAFIIRASLLQGACAGWRTIKRLKDNMESSARSVTFRVFHISRALLA